MRYYCLLLFVLLFVFSTANAQNKKLITGSFQSYSFKELAHDLETNYGYHFFYDPSDVDSLSISIKVNNSTIQQLLDQIFEHEGIFYAVDSSNRIFITKNRAIQTTLPKNFFNSNKTDSTSVLDVTNNEEIVKEKLKVSAENKLFEIGNKGTNTRGGATLAGYIRDSKTGEAITGVSIYIDTPYTIATTDQYGYYSITLPTGRRIIKISSSGMKDTRRQVLLHADGKLDIEMQEYVASLKTVVVSAEKTSNTKSTQMGVNKLSIKVIKKVPVVFGEADVLKVVLSLPGVTSTGEASNGFNVRGGSTDQNLILFSDATIYNPSHLFGFFSSFNADVVKGIELYKSAIPEKYGGRLSSVLDVSMLDGNSKKWGGTAGIGPLTSKITIEGPIKKDKTSIIIAARTTYSDWLLRSLNNSDYSNSKANFYDANLRLTHIINPKNTLYVMGYISSDKFNLNNDTSYQYSNKNANIKWKHIFNNKAYNVTTVGYDRYEYGVSSSQNPVNAFKLGFNINQTYLRSDFVYTPNNKHTISYGINSTFYRLHPGSFEPIGPKSLVLNNTVAAEQGLESALYLGDQYTVDSKLTINLGLRYSMFNDFGPQKVYDYVPGLPRESTTLIDSTQYSNGKIIKTYSAPEIRFSARYALSDDASLKVSYNTLQQYIHMLSNTVSISPTDIWKLSDPHIKPQQGQQISLGYYKNFKSGMYETSIEVYYKTLKNYLDYKSGANLVLNHHIETDVFSAKGKAYGIELLIKKTSGRLNGWLSYAFSRTFLKQDDPLAGETINKGDYYPASFDKPHNVNFIGNYSFSHRYSLSLNVVYSTGRPITLPLAIFTLGGSPSLYYSERNQYRIPDYFRTDISVNIDGNHKIKQKFHNSWSVGVYNLTGRQNAYSVYFIEENGKIKGYQLSIFGTLIPFVTYNIKF